MESLESDTEAQAYRKTKIVATVGPASRSEEMIERLIQAGVNVFRLNFSHGTHAEHAEVLARIRARSKQLGIPVAILQDLGGPKIRITPVENDTVQLKDNDTVELSAANGSKSNLTHIYVEALDPLEILKVGQRALLSDGTIELIAEAEGPKSIRCKVIRGGTMRSRVGVAFPDSHIELPATTDKDMEDLEWGIKNEVDYVAVSFVKDGKDLQRVRDVIEKHKSDQKIIAKIELRLALDNIYDILARSDSIMVARGDLGLELPLEKLPLIQKELISQANYLGLPVIVATQMLHSMVNSLRPTRAEVSDVATAVMTGTDAVMLSEETAIGKNPVESVQYLDRISRSAEQTFTFEEYRLRLRDADHETVSDAVAYAACAAANKVGASAIIACTETGTSARLVAKYRPQQPLYGISTRQRTLRRMCLYWGVAPISCASSATHEDEITTALSEVQRREKLPNGSRAVITGGLNVRTPGATSVMEIREMLSR